MLHRTAISPGDRIGHGKLVIVAATVIAASMLLASPVDVGAMLTRESSAPARRDAVTTVEIPPEWVWRGREPIDLEFMYGNREPRRDDWIRLGHAH